MHKKIKTLSSLFVAIIIVIIIALTFILLKYFPIRYSEYVDYYSNEYNLEPYYVYAIIKTESGFNPNAVSHKNACGLMQISKDTGKWAADEIGIENYSNDVLFEPEVNIRIGCWYINWLMKEFDNDMENVTLAYNAGNGKVKQWLYDKKYSNNGRKIDTIPYNETKNFLKKVNIFYYIYKNIRSRLI